MDILTTNTVLDMSFGKRLTELRKEKKISQTELAQQLDLHKNVLGRYERDQAKPAIDIAARIAKYMNVSLDYLSGNADADVDEGLLKQVLSIQSLPDDEKKLITRTIDALVRDAKTRHAYAN